MKKGEINGNALKFIAIIAMTLDHVTWAAFPGFSHHQLAIVLHVIGRITCPIMCFFVAEGYRHTGDFKKYLGRMLLFAALSHVPYMLNVWGYLDWHSLIPFYYGSFFNQTGVLWAFAMGLLLIFVNESEGLKIWLKILLSGLICLAAIPADWSCVATILIFLFYKARGDFKKQALSLCIMTAAYFLIYFFTVDRVYGLIQLGACFSLPLLFFYNGKRGGSKKVNSLLKWFFYVYYPAHLMIIWILFKFIVL